MSENQGESKQQSSAAREKSLREATVVLRTGQSAYDNGNYKLAEPLLLKALDVFELQGILDSQEYFLCLSVLADNYYHLHRFFEAKGFYERLSVARLKNAKSTDAQVVVALLKLASCQEKLHEVNDALNSFDLILELAETTIPPGHALFGVIFDSFELLVEKHVDRPDERAERLDNLHIKREQFGFAQTKPGHWDALPSPLSESQTTSRYAELPGGETVLSKNAEELINALSAWTAPELSSRAHDLRVKRASGDQSGLHGTVSAGAAEQSDRYTDKLNDLDDRAFMPDGEKHRQVHLTTDMFKRKPRMGDQSEVALPAVDAADSTPAEVVEPVREGPRNEERLARGAQRIKSDRRPFNPLPILSAVGGVAVVLISVFVAHEWTKTAAVSHADVRASVSAATDLVGKEFVSSDGKKKLRFNTLTDCDYVFYGATVPGVYHITDEPESSSLTGLFNSGAEKLSMKQTRSGFEFSDGTRLYAENSLDKAILNKIQAAANFGTFFYASHEHVYPSSRKDNVAGSTSFSWLNPLTDQVNAPVVESKEYEDGKFDELFVSKLKDFRAGKPSFAVDEAITPLPGQIEALSLVPGGDNSAKPGEAPSAFLIRGYDLDGKMFKSSDPQKAYVVSLKNGVSVDPAKASKEDGNVPAAAAKYSFEIQLDPAPPSSDKSSAANSGKDSSKPRK